MAHDATVSNADNPKDECVFFFGYAQGIFYKAFDAQRYDRIFSGSNDSITVGKQDFLNRINYIKNSPEAKNYPDPDRFVTFFDEIKSLDYQNYKITFS